MHARTLDARKDLQQALEMSRIAVKLSGGDLLYTAHLGYALARAGENDGARVVATDSSNSHKPDISVPMTSR